MRFRFIALVVLALLALPAAPAVAQNTPQAQYTAALARERGLRDAGKPPTLQQLRAGIAAYEAIVHKFPRSGYCDNALWQGAHLSILAYERFGQAADRQRAIRLLNSLKQEYPSSSLVPRVDGALQLAQTAKPAPPAARATPAAPARAPRETPAAPPPPAPTAAAKTLAPTPAGAGALATLRDISRRPIAGGVRVILELDREAAYLSERLENPSRVFFDLLGTEPATWLKDATIRFDDNLVREIRLGRHPQATTRVVLELNGADDYSVFALYEPFRLVVDFKKTAPVATTPVATSAVVRAAAPAGPGTAVRTEPAAATPEAPAAGAGADPTPAASAREPAPRVTAPELKTLPTKPAAPLAAPEVPSANANGKYSLARQLGLGISRIVIDAGHGGHDPGTMANGLRESELVLDVANRLAALLRKQTDIEVVMTRETDVFIELEERTAIANREGADLFLSIHANSARNLQARGVETYFLNFATNPEAEAVAARENATSSRQMHHLPDIVRAIALNNKINESREFADTIQRAMVQRLSTRNQPITDRGVKQAPFVVLIGAEMPSVLAEIAFLTNRQDAALLKTSAFRQQIAQALFDGIVKYQQSVKKGRITASAR
jgi:N-acetylmuramoyl-L-alanine amidase